MLDCGVAGNPGDTIHVVSSNTPSRRAGGGPVVKLLLWLILLVVCWPIALVALVLYPLVWVLALPFRLIGIAVDGVFAFLHALVMLPARVLGGGRQG